MAKSQKLKSWSYVKKPKRDNPKGIFGFSFFEAAIIGGGAYYAWKSGWITKLLDSFKPKP